MLTGPATARADEPSGPATPMEVAPQRSPMLDLRDRLMFLKLGWSQGLSGVAVYQDGKALDLGFFGENARAAFAEVPEALAAAESYRVQKLVGVGLWAVGMAALVADLIFLVDVVVGGNTTAFAEDQGVIWGLLAGGAAVGIAGGVLLGNASRSLSDAVSLYNAGLLNRYLPDREKIDVHLFSGANSHGLALGYRF